MKAIKAGIITKSTKAELEQLEREQEGLELRIAQEQIKRPVISLEQIELWITHFAKTELTAPEQQQRLIDSLINGIYVYDDKMVVVFNYKDVSRSMPLEDVESIIKKENTHLCSECSSLVKSGDPYGN